MAKNCDIVSIHQYYISGAGFNWSPKQKKTLQNDSWKDSWCKTVKSYIFELTYVHYTSSSVRMHAYTHVEN
jgi:hypothetical protein